MKKLLALVLVLALSLSLVSFAGAEAVDPADILTDGYWTYSFFQEGYGEFDYFFHFYKDVPGFGNVYYAGFVNNQMCFAGTWDVTEAETPYSVREDRLRDDMIDGTAPYAVSLYDWNGNKLDTCAFDGENLYNMAEKVYGMYSSPFTYVHDTEGVTSKYAKTYEEEKGIAVVDFISPEDKTCTLTIYHNGRYMDLVGMMVEGTWAMTENEDGSRVYALTPDEEGDTPATLTVSADTATAHYVNEDGDEMDLENTQKTANPVYQWIGTHPFMEGMDAALTLTLYDDGTCEVVAEVFGNAAAIDAGTWKLGDDGFTFSFAFEGAGEATSTLNMETYTPEVQYVLAGTSLGDIDATLAIVKE